MFHTVLLLACDASLVGMAGRKCSLIRSAFVCPVCVLLRVRGVFLACCWCVVVVVVRAGGAVCVEWVWWAYLHVVVWL